ncbi:MAG: signal peptidase II [Deltaproteobacteria bacterium GWA2_54_12]|nr:MAG: signal peptidase II [Deltaproteobacteria bacterium GWA2_54_12]
MKIFSLVGAAVLVLDQITKLAVTAVLAPYEIVEAVPGFFNLVYYRNPGAAFGILNRSGFSGKLILIGISIGALVLIASMVRGSKDRLYTWALSLIAGGAAGNLVDRIRQGSVVDFLDFHISGHHWPAFNVADSAITAGVGLALLSFFISRKNEN